MGRWLLYLEDGRVLKGKTRTILLSVATWQELMSFRSGGQDDPVFPSWE